MPRPAPQLLDRLAQLLPRPVHRRPREANLLRLTVGDYLDDLATVLDYPAMNDFRKDLALTAGADLNLAASFLRSWEQVQDEHARRLLLLAGHCAPRQPIPCPLLEQAADLDPGPCDAELSILTGLGLLKMEDPRAGLLIHALLAKYARALPGEEPSPLRPLVRALGKLASQANRSGLPERFLPLRPHVEAVAPAAQAAGLEEAGALFNELGCHLNMVADHAGARAAYARALAILERFLPPDHPNVRTVRENLAALDD